MRSLNKYAVYFSLPFLAGLLVLPFVGPGYALCMSGIMGAAGVLWEIAGLRIVGNVARSFYYRVNALWRDLSSAISPLGSRTALLGLLFFLIVFPIFLNDYYQDIMILTSMYIVLALGLNIIVGQTGLLNLGYAAFYAIGAYTYAILSTQYGVSFWVGMVIGALAAAIVAVVLGLPTLKLRGDYFAIVTLGFGEITRIVLNNWASVTGGPNGIARIGRPMLGRHTLSTTLELYYLILLIVMVTVFAVHRLMFSRIGRAWIAIREDEIAAEAMGINTFRLKLLAFVIGCAWAGMTGVFFAAKMAFVSPESFTFFESVLILCMVVLGGMGSIPGIILGALCLIALPEVFRDFQDYRMLAFGIALVLMMIFRPQGLLGSGRKA